MTQRPYYDHEPVYQRIASSGGRGWDDNGIPGNNSNDSYRAVEAYLDSPWAPSPGARALDLGCGGGQVSIRLAQRGYVTTGIEISETAIELAKQNARDAGLDIQFLVGDALTLAGIADRSVDLVVDNHVLHCLVTADDRRAFLASACRVLVPRGRFFSETMSCEGDFDPARFDVDPATRRSRSGRRYWVGEAELHAELIEAGLRVTHHRRVPSDPGIGDLLVTYAARKDRDPDPP
jgi:SAM-dependent methyltransferase